ncbi:MAG: DUF1573 domain-containing protein [Crocinitomicaceae bacterium]|nr:DUF1573 domain-containing protein [Crocinitomicaceae bacterium]
MMKLLTLSLLLTMFVSCETAEEDVQVGNKTTMKIDRLYDAGEVMKGEVVTAKFKVTNTGKYPLILASVEPSCSCTVSSYPEKIAPGESNIITATVKTDRLGSGILSKHVNVTANTSPSVTQLKIKALIMNK